jgi:hypothetical protein
MMMEHWKVVPSKKGRKHICHTPPALALYLDKRLSELEDEISYGEVSLWRYLYLEPEFAIQSRRFLGEEQESELIPFVG